MTIDVAILGCAHAPHAASYAAAIVAGRLGKLVGVHDPTRELGEPLAVRHGVPYFEDAERLLRECRPKAVVVCSSTVHHRELVELSVRFGVHVLCEKPLATTASDAIEMVELCRNANVQLHTAFVSRFYPFLLEVREIVREGQLGALRAMVGGNRGAPPIAPKFPGWITDPTQAGGGALIDHAVHVIDAMRFVSGLEAISAVAETGTLFTGLEVEDSALVSIVFEGGVVASVDSSWSVPVSNPWDYDFYMRVVGTSGSLSVASGPESIGVVGGDSRGRSFRQVSFEPDINRAMIDAFLESVQQHRIIDPCASGTDGIRASEIVEAAYGSIHTHALTAIDRATV